VVSHDFLLSIFSLSRKALSATTISPVLWSMASARTAASSPVSRVYRMRPFEALSASVART
jgi:hypothetical protein